MRPSTLILNQIAACKRIEVEEDKRRRPFSTLMEIIEKIPPARDFKEAISTQECAIIAEVKQKSPSRGLMRESFDPCEIAGAYEAYGATAISVLTDEPFFGGQKEDLSRIREKVRLPLLRKDFIIDPYQVYETKCLGGDAILLIARLLGKDLGDYIGLAESLGLFPLVEIHSREELDMALAAGAVMIGINNRDLMTFDTDLKTSIELTPLIPKGRIVVGESGIHSRADIMVLMEAGIRAFLVGETLMRANDMAAKFGELLGR
jgi:indole-3-glycerol phosphate synthase